LDTVKFLLARGERNVEATYIGLMVMTVALIGATALLPLAKLTIAWRHSMVPGIGDKRQLELQKGARNMQRENGAKLP